VFPNKPIREIGLGNTLKLGNKSHAYLVVLSMNKQTNATRKGRQIETNDNTSKNDQLLNPNFGLNTDTPDVKGFLEWLFNPEVDKALEQFIAEHEND
jgi:hypothetical protein